MIKNNLIIFYDTPPTDKPLALLVASLLVTCGKMEVSLKRGIIYYLYLISFFSNYLFHFYVL